jgi:hypothetical protein
MTLGSAAATLLVFAWSRVTSITAYYLVWAGLDAVMAAVLYEPAFAVVTRWFARRRARALLTITLVAGMASTIFLPLTEALVARLGWRSTLAALSLLLGLVTTPVLFAALALALLLLSLAHGLAMAVAAAGLLGMANGLMTLARATEVADRWGVGDYGRISGLLAFGTTLARAAGPIGAAWLLAGLGGYGRVLALLGGLAIARVDAELALTGIETMEALLDASVWRQRLSANVLMALGVAALAIAVLGVFGIVSYLVSQRAREIGVRMALGATRGEIGRMVMGEGLRLILAGVGLGLAGAWALSRTLSGLLYGVTADDPATFAGLALFLAAAALLACALPARRAARVEALAALRHE